MNNFNFYNYFGLVCKAYISDFIALYDNIDESSSLCVDKIESEIGPQITMVAIIEGNANAEINGKRISIGKGAVMCLAEIFMLKIHEITPDFKAVGFGFFSKAIKDSKDSLKLNHSIYNLEKESFNIIKVDYKQIDYFLELYNLFSKWCRNTMHPYYKYIIQNLTNILIVKAINLIDKYPDIAEISQKSIVSRQNVIFHNFLKLLDDYVDEQRSVSFYAGKLNVTPKYLSDITRIYTGKCASDNIEQMVIKRIIFLFSEEKYAIKQICEIMNFNSQSFFGRYFKRGTGLSPKEYLKKFC